MEMAEDKPR